MRFEIPAGTLQDIMDTVKPFLDEKAMFNEMVVGVNSAGVAFKAFNGVFGVDVSTNVKVASEGSVVIPGSYVARLTGHFSGLVTFDYSRGAQMVVTNHRHKINIPVILEPLTEPFETTVSSRVNLAIMKTGLSISDHFAARDGRNLDGILVLKDRIVAARSSVGCFYEHESPLNEEVLLSREACAIITRINSADDVEIGLSGNLLSVSYRANDLVCSMRFNTLVRSGYPDVMGILDIRYVDDISVNATLLMEGLDYVRDAIQGRASTKMSFHSDGTITITSWNSDVGDNAQTILDYEVSEGVIGKDHNIWIDPEQFSGLLKKASKLTSDGNVQIHFPEDARKPLKIEVDGAVFFLTVKTNEEQDRGSGRGV